MTLRVTCARFLMSSLNYNKPLATARLGEYLARDIFNTPLSMCVSPNHSLMEGEVVVEQP